ncbi:MAG: 16S rRNA (guanine(966)-N(2))-methyltransferase RsmD, partial [Acidobacteriota bacterium]
MRVIAGRLRGRRLRGPRKTELRPTGDRLKESLFSILDPDLRGASVLDVFAGTGAIGIEAVSRGASEVVFIDSGEGACRLVRRNLDLCGITSGYTLVHDDVFKALRRLGREGRRFDVVFLDPPYDWGPCAELIALVFRLGIAGEGSRVCM